MHFQSPEDVIDEDDEEDVLQPVHINVRQLTKKDVFGMEPHLYSNQPSLTLVSNGAECLMLNKKFYLENANEECMKWLKEAVRICVISSIWRQPKLEFLIH